MNEVRKLLVIGGSGFVGLHICQAALAANYQVISLSLSGRCCDDKWADKVKWIKGNATNPKDFRDIIQDISGVVHSVGLKVDSNLQLLGIASCYYYEKSYEQVNRDTAIIPATEIAEYQRKNPFSPKKHFVFISAEKGVFYAHRYLSSKRQAEDFLFENQKDGLLTTTILRPGNIYQEKSNYLRLQTQIASTVNNSNSSTKNSGLFKLIKKLTPAKPVSVEKVANACIQAFEKENLKGKIIYSEEIDAKFQTNHQLQNIYSIIYSKAFYCFYCQIYHNISQLRVLWISIYISQF